MPPPPTIVGVEALAAQSTWSDSFIFRLGHVLFSSQSSADSCGDAFSSRQCRSVSSMASGSSMRRPPRTVAPITMPAVASTTFFRMY